MALDPGGARSLRGLACRALGAAADAGVLALAAATAAGLALDAAVVGSAIHPLWMGSTGVPTLDSLLAAAFAVLVIFGGRLAGRAPRATRAAVAIVGGFVIVLTGAALGSHLAALADGRLKAAGLAPPATFVALALVVPWTLRASGSRAGRRNPRRIARAAALVAAGVLLVLAQIEAVGATDYRAPADAILVLGSKVNADGRASGSLLDRTRTACALWRDGLAPVLVLSGGHGAEAPVSEPEAMREIALEEGVPDGALVLDETGIDTASSIRFAARLSRERGWRRVLVVSHDYHLARIRLLADREGLVVRTVPAEETCPPGWKRNAIAREVAAYVAAWSLGL